MKQMADTEDDPDALKQAIVKIRALSGREVIAARDLMKGQANEPAEKRIRRIKESLRGSDLNPAASLLVSAVSSDDMFGYWSGCCRGSERVPKILKYIRHIAFDPNVPTAVVNFRKGDLKIGAGFFLEHIEGPEDLLFILIHERNHLILRSLYPDVSPAGYPPLLFNFGEDAFINAISRRYVPSTLPERFYKKPAEMLLTGRHSQIDWDYFIVLESGVNILMNAHAGMYMSDYGLMNILGEGRLTGGQVPGYRQWMRLIEQWHRQMEAKGRWGRRVDEPCNDTGEPEAEDDRDQAGDTTAGPMN